MTTLRLIFTENCNRSCPKCCNKDFDFSTHKSWKWSMYDKYAELNISGGEPMLYPSEVIAFIHRYRALEFKTKPPMFNAKIYLYTALVKDLTMVFKVLKLVNGLTLTLHDQTDVAAFEKFNYDLNVYGPYNKSLRLSVFKGIVLKDKPYPLWNIMMDRQWLDDCPLPEDDMLILRHNFER